MSDEKRPAQVIDAQELLRRASLTPRQARDEIRREKLNNKRRDEEENVRQVRIRKPWNYETDKPMTEPPDMNYRKILVFDERSIDQLFEDKGKHFTNRCIEYERQDLDVECDILYEFHDWASSMASHAQGAGDDKRREFFRELDNNLRQDLSGVLDEWWFHGHSRSVKSAQAERTGRLSVPHDENASHCYCSRCYSPHTDCKCELCQGIVAGCECSNCESKRRENIARHGELEKKARQDGKTIFKNGIPGCDCAECLLERSERTRHKIMKYRQYASGNFDVARGVDGCRCSFCLRKPPGSDMIMTVRDRWTHHQIVKRQEWVRGNSNFQEGIPGCSCDSCEHCRQMYWVRSYCSPYPSDDDESATETLASDTSSHHSEDFDIVDGGIPTWADLPSPQAQAQAQERENASNSRTSKSKSRSRSSSYTFGSSSSSSSTDNDIPRPGRTRVPAKFITKHAIIQLGFPFDEEGNETVIQRALTRQQIDELIQLSENLKSG